MKKSLLFMICVAAVVLAARASCAAQAGEPAPKAGAEALKKFVGRYELDAPLAPVSTLDVTLEGGALWVKPSQLKKRKLTRQSRNVFQDEVEGAPYTFDRDEEGNVVGLTFRHEGQTYTARRVVLPPPSLKGNTTFRLKGYADAQVVALAGTFNNWNQSQLLFAREGDEWVCRVDLAPGRYAYKFIVDGQWMLDPSNPQTEEDEAGNVNSLLVLEDK